MTSQDYNKFFKFARFYILQLAAHSSEDEFVQFCKDFTDTWEFAHFETQADKEEFIKLAHQLSEYIRK